MMLPEEQKEQYSEEFRKVVDEWPEKRIAALQSTLNLPAKRISAMLGIGISTLRRLGLGMYTPSPALCNRMQTLEDMAASGNLHQEYTPKKREMQRRMTLFRAWWFSKKPSVEMPMITAHIQVRWGASPNQSLSIPLEYLPALRLTKWEGLVEVIRAVATSLRRVARDNSRVLFKPMEAEFWARYANDTLPKIVVERAKIPQAAAQKSRQIWSARRKGKEQDDGSGIDSGRNAGRRGDLVGQPEVQRITRRRVPDDPGGPADSGDHS
jgi:hypothetical protein